MLCNWQHRSDWPGVGEGEWTASNVGVWEGKRRGNPDQAGERGCGGAEEEVVGEKMGRAKEEAQGRNKKMY